MSPGIAPALPRGSAHDRVSWSRSALRGPELRGVSLVRTDSGRHGAVSVRWACRPESLLHSREAPLMTQTLSSEHPAASAGHRFVSSVAEIGDVRFYEPERIG